MRTRLEYETIEQQILAPYATCSAQSKGRQFEEAPHPYRTHFQRDRDRILHSKSFRRLEYKTQVFVNHEGDHYRTRLTHTLEVAQISRSIARMLKLNEDLAEAIALAHDLGHPPFGHSGEIVMNELMQAHGGFEHNRQSLRIVTELEHPYAAFAGLNLSFEVLEGMCKHGAMRSYLAQYFRQSELKSEDTIRLGLEAQLVDLADEIAYNNHDLDDGLRSGMITLGQLQEVEIWREVFQEVWDQYQNANEALLARNTVKALINQLVIDLTIQTEKNIERFKIRDRNDVTLCQEKLVAFSETTRQKTIELKKFLFKNLYRHYRVERMADKAGRILRDLFFRYQKNPGILPNEIQAKLENETAEIVIGDYLAGMTDRFALEEHEKLFDPKSRV